MSVSALPTSWRLITLGEVAAPVPNAIVDGPFGSNLKTCDYVDEGVPVLQGKNITNDSFRWFDVRFISNQKAAELKRSSVKVGDILIIKIGSIGYSAIVENLNGFQFAIIPANLAKITPDASKVDLLYLHKWLTSVDAKRYLISVASKTAQPALSLGKIKSLPLPLPPLAEQKRIAGILDAADALRAKSRESLAQLDSLLQSSFLTLFGDPVSNPMGWPTTSLIDQCDEKRGISYGVVQRGSHVPSGVPVIRIRDLTGSGIDPGGLIRCSKEITSTYRRTILQGGELVISIRGTVGRIGLVPPELKDGNITRELALIPLKAGVVREFVLELLKTDSVFRRLADDVKGIAQRGINLKDLRELAIILPPLPLQRRFAAIVESVERQKERQRSHLAELDALFAALQHRAFRGEL